MTSRQPCVAPFQPKRFVARSRVRITENRLTLRAISQTVPLRCPVQ